MRRNRQPLQRTAAKKIKRHPVDHRTKPRSTDAILVDLKHQLAEIYDLNAAGSVLTWDEATYMPNGGAIARGRQIAMLRRLAHERFIDPTLGRLLNRLDRCSDNLPADDASLIRVVRRDYEKAIRIPAEYVARVNAHGSASYNAWRRARPANDFATVIPFLERTLDLSREYASFFAPYDHIADPMIDDADEGLTATTVRRVSAGAPPLRKFTPNWRVRSGSFGCQSVHPMAVVIADARVQCQECFENLLLTEHIEGPRSGCRGRGRVTAHKIIETLTQYHGTARKELLPLAVDLLTTVLQTPSRVSA